MLRNNGKFWALSAMLGVLGAFGAMGCEDTPGTKTPPSTEETNNSTLQMTGLAMAVDLLAQSDVKGMRFEIASCDGEQTWAEFHMLEELMLPGGIDAFEDQPLDAQSRHVFADHFMVLPAGCYNVRVIPMLDESYQSRTCTTATAYDVMVEDAKTTEILLVSQCEGPAMGAIDVLGVINHPPTIKQLTYDPSKFVSCPDEVRICVEARDPDRDPMEFEWTQVSGSLNHSGLSVVSSTQENGVARECVRFKPRKTGSFAFRVTAFDKFHRKGDGGLIRAEAWYDMKGYGHIKSRDVLNFPVYASCPKKYDDHDSGNGGMDGGNGDYDGGHDGGKGGHDGGKGGHDGGYDGGHDGGKGGHDGGYDGGHDGGKGGHDGGYDGGHDGGKGDGGHDGGYEDPKKPKDGCTYTQGYWKNHNRYAVNRKQRLNWPISEDTMLCGMTWLKILRTAPGNPPSAGPQSNHWYVLAHQYIAARLNRSNGAWAPYMVRYAIHQSTTMLERCTISAEHVGLATSLADLLASYNEGKLGPGHCDDKHESDHSCER